LTAGNTVTVTPESITPFVDATGPLATQMFTLVPSGNGVLAGNLTVEVFRDIQTQSLDFLYQVTNTTAAGSNAIITDTSMTNFGMGSNFTTRVGDSNNGAPGFATPGTVAATTVSRVPTSTIDFTFDTTGLASGQTSNVIFIRTNANAFNNFGTATLNGTFNGGTGNDSISTNGVFQPTTTAAVPEPGSVALCGFGLGAVGAVQLFRRRRSQV